MSLQTQKALAHAFGLLPPEEPVRKAEDTSPGFDGGVRETAPEPPDPERDHGRLVVEAIRNLGGGG